MNIFVVLLAILAVSTFSRAAVRPRGQPDIFIDHERPNHQENDEMAHDPKNSPLVRHKRLTCDVFSFESGVVTPKDAPCALKCIGMGKKGGHCEGHNCVCRDDKWVPW